MRIISEEQKNQTLTLLFSAPVSMTDIILGKYLSIIIFLMILVAMLALMPLSLMLGTAVDIGQLFSALLGLCLLLASFAAAGVYMSTLTKHPAIAAISSFGLLLFLWMINWAGNNVDTELAVQHSDGVLSWLSLLSHYEPLLKGVFSSTDIAYFILFIFLVFAIRRLERLRLPH